MELEKTFERAKEFMDNFSKKRSGISNVYVFSAVDRDGNIVDEKYGMNLMTNNGFLEIYGQSRIPFNARDTSGDTVRLYVGTDVDQTPYSVQDTDLREPAFGGLAATNTNTTKDYAYPIYYAEGEGVDDGLITLISRFMICKYDRNITGFPGQAQLSEYGIKHNNVLWTHSRIYDIQGRQTTITKDSSVELYITVYMCLSFEESLIMNGWAQNRYLMITTNHIMYDAMGWSTRVKVYKSKDRVIDITGGGVSRTENTITDNEFTLSIISPQAILYNNNSDAYDTSSKALSCGYIDGFMLTETTSNGVVQGFMVVEPQVLTTPENVTCIGMMSANATKYTGFADKFGVNPSSGFSIDQYPQMTRFFDASAFLFDVKSGDWTCELDIYNPDNKSYDYTPELTNGCLPIYYWNNDQPQTAYVYQNIQVNDRITAITSGAISIYATNKYWLRTEDSENTDPDKGWVWIRNYNNIPAACQTARYWITNTNSSSLTFVRESDVFQLLEKGTNTNGYATYSEYAEKYYIKPISDNYEYGWYKRGNTVYVPDRTGRETFIIGSENDETMTFDKWMIVFPSVNNTIIITDMSSARSGGSVTPQNVTTPFTTAIGNVNSLTQTHRTESGTGLICMESTVTEECVVIDARGSSAVTTSVHSWKHACCIWGTNKIAYIAAGSSDPTVHILDMSSTPGTEEGVPIPFPSGISDIPHIFGHTNFLWMTDGSTFGYVCDLRTPSTRTLVECDYSGLYGSGLNTVKYTCVDEVFIMYKTNECGNSEIPKAHYVRLSDPTHPTAMTDFNVSVGTTDGRIDFVLRYVNKHTTQSSLPSAALMLMIIRGWSNDGSNHTGCDSRVTDFGRYLNTGTVVWKTNSSSTNLGNLCLYGGNIILKYKNKIPIMNWLPIKLVGKTNTINAMLNIKNIINKSWLLRFTNIPRWGTTQDNGKPPGKPVARTNINGTITKWS